MTKDTRDPQQIATEIQAYRATYGVTVLEAADAVLNAGAEQRSPALPGHPPTPGIPPVNGRSLSASDPGYTSGQ